MYKYIVVMVLVLGAGVVSAQHTFSICAVDPLTGEVGSAGASCIENSRIISDVHPGVGVIHTQAYYIAGNQNYAESLMDEGVAPSAIIDSMIANDIFDDPSFRQYGVVDLVDGGRSAGYTGENTMDWKGHLTGPNYAIQGNILLGPEILNNMEANFLATEGNLGCKLMSALQGAKVPGADTRCAEFDISALSSFLRVARPTDEPGNLLIDLRVYDVEGDSIDPIDSLQTLYDAIGGCNFNGVSNLPLIAPTIYPQPTNSSVIFQLSQAYDRITFSTINGEIVFTKSITGLQQLSINCENWTPGIYLYQLITKEGNQTGKIIVE